MDPLVERGYLLFACGLRLAARAATDVLRDQLGLIVDRLRRFVLCPGGELFVHVIPRLALQQSWRVARPSLRALAIDVQPGPLRLRVVLVEDRLLVRREFV